MSAFDKNRPFGHISGVPGGAYEQNGRLYDRQGQPFAPAVVAAAAPAEAPVPVLPVSASEAPPVAAKKKPAAEANPNPALDGQIAAQGQSL